MTDRPTRSPKPASTPAPRSLLNLGGGDRRGLQRAFQALVGRAGIAEAPADPLETHLVQVLQLLQSLGFVLHSTPGDPPALSHPLAPDRRIALVLSSPETDPEATALAWATRNFPEMEFYLPFIILRATRQKRLAGAGPTRPRPPEPEYDEDGFLADQP